MKYLKDLLGHEIHENGNNEFKQRVQGDLTGLLKEICAFANSGGGDIYIGVKDGDAELCGLSHEELDPLINRIKNEAKQFLKPKASIEPELLKYQTKGGERYVLRLHIAPNKELPVFLYRGSSSVYLRSYSQTVLADPDEIFALYRLSGKYVYDQEKSDVSYDRSSFSTLFGIYRDNAGKDLDEHRLSSLPFFDEEGRLYKGSLLFMDGFEGEETSIAVTRYQGFDRGGNLIQKLYEGHGNILKMIEEASKAVSMVTFSGMGKNGDIGHEEVVSYPKKALAEAITNAFAHKDYSMDKSLVEICIFNDRIEVISPGGLLDSRRLIKEKDLLSISPKRRNPLISSVLTMIGYMESAGSGFTKISSCYEDADSYHKPFVDSSVSRFSLTLPDLLYEHGIVDDDNPNISLSFAADAPRLSGKYDYEILRYCYFSYRSLSEIAGKTSMKVSTHLRNNVVLPLVEKGLLLAHEGNGMMLYRTSHNLVKIS